MAAWSPISGQFQRKSFTTILLLVLLVQTATVHGFANPRRQTTSFKATSPSATLIRPLNEEIKEDDEGRSENSSFFAIQRQILKKHENRNASHERAREQEIVEKYNFSSMKAAATSTSIIASSWLSQKQMAAAASFGLSTGDFDPNNFRPVCPASDTFYRSLQGITQALVGGEKFVEYGPLIAGGLLRVRLELCVVESFFNEAVGPFIRQNGVNWVLPLHETVETFLAGTIFALATTFILVGSTKLVTVIVTYSDVFLGAPCRFFGGFFFDRARGKPVTLDIGLGPFKTRVIGPKDTPDEDGEEKEALIDFANTSPVQLPVIFASGTVKSVGEVCKVLRQIMEALDLFVGRYLVLLATGYIGIKFLHFKIFPGFPPV